VNNATSSFSHLSTEKGFLTSTDTTTLKPSSKRIIRRHSLAESWFPNEVTKRKPKTFIDIIMAEKQVLRPESISTTHANIPKIKTPGGHVYGGEELEEIMKLLENDEAFDDEIINGLIKSLKIPIPSLKNPPFQKEILFPARIISFVAKQMWKYGFIKESERLFASVMKIIQEHVM
ncbi:28915_t:CDS:2, partial [Dentiscutata erythropus]